MEGSIGADESIQDMMPPSSADKGYTSACSYKRRNGVMGVPITFLDKYSPEQFRIIDINPHFFYTKLSGNFRQLKIVGTKDPYARLLIQKVQQRDNTKKKGNT